MKAATLPYKSSLDQTTRDHGKESLQKKILNLFLCFNVWGNSTERLFTDLAYLKLNRFKPIEYVNLIL